MDKMISLVGFGEAGRCFTMAGGWAHRARVFDAKTSLATEASGMRRRYTEADVTGCASLAEAITSAQLILSLVTADQALAVAEAVATYIAPESYFCDMNSVSPQTKQAAAAAIQEAGGHYIDVAVMAPVDRARLAVPLLASGARAGTAAALLADMGFTNCRVVGVGVGRASSIKMIRSVIVKGMEALSAECVLAANEAGVLDEVLASLDGGEELKSWRARADYNLDRMMVHGLRRAAEMEEVVKTLDGFGTGSAMSRGTVERQRAIGVLRLHDPAAGLNAKLGQLNSGEARAA